MPHAYFAKPGSYVQIHDQVFRVLPKGEYCPDCGSPLQHFCSVQEFVAIKDA